jgi:ParB family transcriptional regulator, chromosome partitioning protein
MTKQTKINTQTATDIIEYLPLADLYLSDLNPRQEVCDDGIALLAQSLVTCGLIQNLAGLRNENGKVAIVAGGRRLRALQIATLERVDLGLVPVRMAPNEQTALEWASAENTARTELDRVDEVRAYGKMAADNTPVAHISRAFGVTEAHVRKRLALAGLPVAVLDALKAGEISLGIAKAMTISKDEGDILKVLEEARGDKWFDERRVKRQLNPIAIDGNNRMAQFVGEEAYKAAGGAVTQDLFENEVLFNNPDILEGLFAQKLDDEATALQEAQGWAWVMTSEDSQPYWHEVQSEHGFARVYKVEGVLTEEQQARNDELDKLGWEADLSDTDAAELAVLEAIVEGDYSEAQKQHAGVMVYVSHSGKVETIQGLVKKDDQAAAIDAGVLTASAHEDNGTTTAAPKAEFSQKFMADMQAVRLAAVQTGMLEKPEFVLDLLAFALSPASGHCTNVLGLRFSPERNAPEIDDSFILSPRIGGPLTEEEEIANDKLESHGGGTLSEKFAAYRKTGKKDRNAQITETRVHG